MFGITKWKLPMMITLIIVLVVGAVVAISSFSSKKEIVQDPASREVISNNGWEVMFFSALEERTQKVGLPKLETNVVNTNDLELRYWYDAAPHTINGLVIRHSSDVWSASRIRQTRDPWPSPMRQEDLGVPKSGWNALWKQLTDAGILTLPDSDDINCTSGALDGIGIVVEVLTKQGYRTYRYDNPQLGACAEAKQLMTIQGILADEFNLHAR